MPAYTPVKLFSSGVPIASKARFTPEKPPATMRRSNGRNIAIQNINTA